MHLETFINLFVVNFIGMKKNVYENMWVWTSVSVRQSMWIGIFKYTEMCLVVWLEKIVGGQESIIERFFCRGLASLFFHWLLVTSRILFLDVEDSWPNYLYLLGLSYWLFFWFFFELSSCMIRWGGGGLEGCGGLYTRLLGGVFYIDVADACGSVCVCCVGSYMEDVWYCTI